MKYLFTFIFLLFTLSGRSQRLTVLDQQSRHPLENAEVRTQLETHFTSKAGQVTLSDSLHAITIHRVGYRPVRLNWDQIRRQAYTVFLSEDAVQINEVVVSASRIAQPQSQVAQPVRVINRSDIRFLNQPTTAEVLQQSGQVLVQKSQLGGGSPILRGFEANKVLLVVDGIRMNNAVYRGGHLQNILTVDNSILEKAEVALGPGSVQYGSDALGGVIYLQTLTPIAGMVAQGNAFARYSTAAAEKTLHADNAFSTGRWALATSVTGSDFGDLRQGNRRPARIGSLGLRPFYAGRETNTDVLLSNPDPNKQTPSGYKQVDLLQKVLFQPAERTSHLLNVQYSTTSDIPRYDRLSEVDGQGRLRHAQWYYGPQERLLTAYTFMRRMEQGMADNLQVIAAYQTIEESRHNRRFGNNTLQHRIERLGIWTLNADLQKKISPAHDLRYGLEATYNNVQSTAYGENILTSMQTPLDTRYPDGGSDTQSLSAYVSGTVAVSTRSSFCYGARYGLNRLYARFSDKTFFPFPFGEVTQRNAALTGSLGWVTRLPGNWRLAASLASGYRVPNVDDLAKVFESVVGTLIVPNPSLKPERTYNADAGIQKRLGERFTLEAEGFYTRYAQAITTQPATLNGQATVLYNGRASRVVMQTNAQQAYLYGFSTRLTAQFTSALSAYGNLSYTYGRIKTDTTDYPLDHIPPLFGQAGLRWQQKQFRAEANVLFNGAKQLNDYNLIGEDNIVYATPQGMPGWYTVNLRSSYQLSRLLLVQVNLENLLDRNYRVFASGISAPGRNLIATVRVTW
ncbi:TonB-dependent receptor [Nibrella saemangeumensis]|uniref:TonB-dependent receptor n=1 Tax=Nibrella saemangeumensis TaxID=1084526 RepID=A0ABP8NEG4_9BACT